MLDKTSQISDNVLNDEYAALAGLSEHTQVVKMDEQVPVNDTECRHETLIPDPKDTIGEAVYHGCANRKCGVGFYINMKT